MIAFERHNIDITFLIMKQRSELWNNGSELWNNGSELWNNDINIDITYNKIVLNYDIAYLILT
jgi:hypothetical protein